MTFHKLLALLIAAILFVGSPAFAAAGDDGASACASESFAADDCCGGSADTSECTTTCLVSPTVMHISASTWSIPATVAALLEDSATHERSLAWPPDTAPPKPRSA